jgi:hypothetical protein
VELDVKEGNLSVLQQIKDATEREKRNLQLIQGVNREGIQQK